MTSPTRLSYEESCRLLQSLGYLYGGTIPPLPARMPYADDENPGVSFYKTRVTGEGLENLTIPRTYFGRSQVGPISFRNTDLSESVLCWNDFEGVDFGACDLSRSDLRASNYERVRFVAADLRGGDLRRSSFVACDFTDALMGGVKLTVEQGVRMGLSEGQSAAIDWQRDDGEEPEGG